MEKQENLENADFLDNLEHPKKLEIEKSLQYI